MIHPRIIPILLLNDSGGVVKTQNFSRPVYIGDPINAVKIFNEKEVDELILLDISASLNKISPNYSLIKEVVSESFMPMGYGGGIKSLDQIKNLFDLGLEKVIINSAMFDYDLIDEAANIFGSQSIVISIDIRKSLFNKYHIFTKSGTLKHNNDFKEHVRRLCNFGAGEIIIQSIDKEGLMRGYDLELIEIISSLVNIPIVASGGAGSLEDMRDAIRAGASASAAGSLFVFKGSEKGILINYPNHEKLKELFYE
jgi:cyclase